MSKVRAQMQTACSSPRAVDSPAHLIARDATSEEVLGWDELVSRFANHQIYHLQCWIKLIESFSGARPLYIVLERDGDLVACLPGFLVRIGLLRIFASPLEGWQTEYMGPVFNPDQVSTRELFSALTPFLERRYGIHHMELVCRDIDPEEMRVLGFESKLIPSFLTRLYPGDEAKTLKSFPHSTRNHLRKAIKLGLSAIVETNVSFVDDLYAQMQQVFIQKGYVVPFKKNRVEEGFRRLVPEGKALAISISLPGESRRIATGMFLIYKTELSLWHWAHLKEYGSYCPIELLTWTAIQEAMQSGCTCFDVGGGRGRQKFSAEQYENVYRCIRSRYRWLIQLRSLAKKLYRWQQSLRGRIRQRMKLKRTAVENANS